MLHFENINDVNNVLNLEDSRHHLIDIRKYSDILPKMPRADGTKMTFGFYDIILKKNFNGLMTYGKTKYDGTKGILYFMEPGQIFSCSSKEYWDGYRIYIHPDIFKNNIMAKSLKAYSFFSYEINEALILTDKEERTLSFIMNEAWEELNNNKDDFSIPIILSYISSILNAAERFYTRQFNTRKIIYNQLTSDFLQLLRNYYTNTVFSERQPSVFFFSEKLHVTPNYLSDIVKHNTGKSALNIIHEYIIDEAKILLSTTNKTVSQISDILGFEYLTYFSRLFKKKTKISPSNYRKSVKNI